MGGGGNSAAAPAPRDLGQETQSTLQAQLRMAPQQYAAYNQYAPQYAQTDISTLGKSLFGNDYSGNLTDINTKLTDYANQQTQQSNTALRGANQADVDRYGAGMQQTLQQMNPDFYQQIARQGSAANAGLGVNPYQQQLQGIAGSSMFNPVQLQNMNVQGVNAPMVSAQGGNAALDAMQSQYLANPSGMSANQTQADQIAQSLLSQGGNLSPSELRNVEQSSRGAFAARGLGGSNSSIVNEAMNTDAAHRARLVQNVGIAQGIEGMSQQQRQNAQQFGMGISGQQQNYGQMGLQAGMANQGAQMQAGLANQQMDYASQLANNQNLLAQQQANLGAAGQQFGMFGQLSDDATNRQMTNFNMGQQALGNYASANFDPYAAILGQQSINQGTNAGLFGQGAGTTGTSNAYTQSQFNPYNQYAQDLYNTNYNAQASANISNANNAAAAQAARVSGGAQIGGAAIGGIALVMF